MSDMCFLFGHQAAALLYQRSRTSWECTPAMRAKRLLMSQYEPAAELLRAEALLKKFTAMK